MVRLVGAYIQLLKVTGPASDGTGGTEAVIALTKDDVELAFDNNIAETTAHSENRTRQRPLQDKANLTFGGILESSAAALVTLGVLDTSNPPKFNGSALNAMDAIRIKVYDRRADANPSQVWLLRDVEFAVDGFKLPQTNYAEWTGTAYINGDIQKVVGA